MGAEGLERVVSGLLLVGHSQLLWSYVEFPFFFLIINLKEGDNIQLVLR